MNIICKGHYIAYRKSKESTCTQKLLEFINEFIIIYKIEAQYGNVNICTYCN